jgi:hypothetical protein
MAQGSEAFAYRTIRLESRCSLKAHSSRAVSGRLSQYRKKPLVDIAISIKTLGMAKDEASAANELDALRDATPKIVHAMGWCPSCFEDLIDGRCDKCCKACESPVEWCDCAKVAQ